MPEAPPLLPQPSADETSPSSSLKDLCHDLNDQIEAFLAEDAKDERLKSVQARTRESMGIIAEALERYPLDTLSISYNGGKDCLVLLILYLASLSRLPPSTLPLALESIYIVPPHPFAAVDSFVASSAFHYHLSLLHLRHPSMKEAFSQYLSSHPQIKAIFVGTRRTDPHGEHLTPFQMTDRGWPSFMRVHPVLEWRYADIWAFLRRLGVGWCQLYDEGYTSLGGTRDTERNPMLRREDGGYRPAWMLVEDEEERAGRDVKREGETEAQT